MQEDTDLFLKLNNHRLPIDESYWVEMEGRLRNNQKKLIPLWIWLAGVGVAASLAALLIIQVFSGDNESLGTQMEQVEHKEHKENNVDNVDNEQVIGTQMTQIAQISADRKKSIKSVKSVQSTPSLSSLPSLSSIPPLHDEIPAGPAQDTIIQNQYELKLQHNNFLIAQNQPQLPKALQKNKKSWQIAAAFGSGASNLGGDFTFLNDNAAYLYNFSSGFNHSENKLRTDNYNPDSPTQSGSMRADDIPSFDEIFQDFPEVNHLPPLSFGLTVRRNFNKHLAIETGLTYSFLQSKFRESNERQYRQATLKLHYLGIPFNAVAYLLNKPQWNLYFSLGGTVEKGILLDYVQQTSYHPQYYRDNNPPVYTVSLQDDIPGLQCSFHTSLGIGYKFYRDLSIYLEPRLIYYFKNNQPESVRTEIPFQVGLNAGLRFEFNH
jgi:hypothetical protein